MSMEKSKAELLVIGLKKSYFQTSNADQYAYLTGYLSSLVSQLTSASKDHREWAKEEVRKMVKIGKEAEE